MAARLILLIATAAVLAAVIGSAAQAASLTGQSRSHYQLRLAEARTLLGK